MKLSVGDIVAIILFTATAIDRSSSITTVDLYNNCGDEFTVSAGPLSLGSYRLKIEGSGSILQPSCSVTFRASQSEYDLYYKFTEASINSVDVFIRVYTSSTGFYGTAKDTYSLVSVPRLNSAKKGDTYLRISVGKLAGTDFSVEVEVYAEDLFNSLGLQTWVIACIVVSCIVAVVIVVVIIGCICKNSHASRGRVVAPAHNMQVTTTTVAPPGQYSQPYYSCAIPPPPNYQQLEMQPPPPVHPSYPDNTRNGNDLASTNFTHTK